MKKINIIALFSLISVFSLSAQSIELPDITTVIQGEGIKVENSALPDFNDVLKSPKGSGSIVPELPDIETNVNPSVIVKNTNGSEKSVFSEVLVGGGYPFLFYGNCNVTNTTKNSPFKLAFSYDAASGYEGNELSDNFSDSKINLFVEKNFLINNLLLDFYTSYNLKSNGLQNKVLGMTGINKVLVTGNSSINYRFNNGVSIGTDLYIDFYNRYANLSDKESVISVENWIKKSSLITFKPEVFVNWAGNGFNVNFNGEYLLDGVLFNSIRNGSVHRGNFNTGLKWNNDIANIFGNVGIVFGNRLNGNSVIVPFSAGFEVLFPVYFSNRRFGISGEGGLSSNYNTVSSIENMYDFAGLSLVTSESADWYGKLQMDIPLKAVFTGNLKAEYRQTAFNSGIWEPDYSDESFNNGIYGFYQKPHRLLTTDVALTFHRKIFSIKAGWHANWFDIPVMESMQMFKLNMSFQDVNSKWGVSLFGSYNVNSNWQLPVINVDGFVQLSPGIRLNASVEDIISLFKSNTVNDVGKYIDRGFTASVFLKFVL